MATPTRTCAKDAPDMSSIPRMNSNQRMERTVRIVFPSAYASVVYPVLLSSCGLRGLRARLEDANRKASYYMSCILEIGHGISHRVMGVGMCAGCRIRGRRQKT